MQLNLGDLVALFALVISIIDLALILWDRKPRLRVGLHTSEYWDEDEEMPTPVARLWIDIANLSVRRVWITAITVEWAWHRWLPSRRWKANLPDLQRWEGEAKAPTARFWIEPWGDAALSADVDELEHELKDHKHPGRIWYCIAVCDGLGKWYRSNKVSLQVLSR